MSSTDLSLRTDSLSMLTSLASGLAFVVGVIIAGLA